MLVSVALIRLDVSETIVFESKPNDLNVTVVQVKVVSTILWQIWPYRDWVFVGTKYQEIAFDLFTKLSWLCHIHKIHLL